ncbi:MAG: TolC family protein [Verrucomicrobiales bacterium]
MHFFKRLFTCLGSVSVGCAAVSVEAQESYLVEALGANPEVAAAYESYVAASQRGTQVRALDEPVVSYSEFLSSVETRTGPQERIFSVSQNLPWPGVLKIRRNVANAEARAAWHRYEIKRREVIENVGLAFIEYAYLKNATNRAGENLELLRQLEPVVQQKVRGGGSLATSLRLDVELAVAEQEVETLREQRPGLDARLQSALGREPGEVLPWPSISSHVPPLMPLDRAKQEILTHHPRIALAETRIDGARESGRLAETSKRPTFSLGANAIDIGDGGETAGAVTLGVKLPIRREKYRAQIAEAEAMSREADASLASARQQLLADAVRLHASQQEAAQRLRNYDDKLIPAARQAVDLTQEDFRTDKTSLNDLIEAERILLDLRLMRTRALADAHKAAWKIRALTEPGLESSK